MICIYRPIPFGLFFVSGHARRDCGTYIDIPLQEIQLVADRTLDEPLYPSIVFESKQYNIIYTYNMGHDLYLPAHVVNTKG